MSFPTNDQPVGTPDIDACPHCRQLRSEGRPAQHFLVTPASGGGWATWSAAFLRLLRRMGPEPTQAVIVGQPDSGHRYVQVLIGHGIAHAEASSNVYLEGDSRLSDEQEQLLRELGWLAPDRDYDDADEMPANWYLPRIHGDWQYLTEMLVATMVGVFGFDEGLPVKVRSFAATDPCRDCSWSDED